MTNDEYTDLLFALLPQGVYSHQGKRLRGELKAEGNALETVERKDKDVLNAVTPGQNEKYYLAGALHSGTGKVSYVGGDSKSAGLFISLLQHLKASYRRAKNITLVVDNYIIHKSGKTLRWLKQNPKFRVIYQPVYSPWVNHVERLWQALHDTITRNHSCRSMWPLWQLLRKVRRFMETASPLTPRNFKVFVTAQSGICRGQILSFFD